jgi:hypothetical protein
MPLYDPAVDAESSCVNGTYKQDVKVMHFLRTVLELIYHKNLRGYYRKV